MYYTIQHASQNQFLYPLCQQLHGLNRMEQTKAGTLTQALICSVNQSGKGSDRLPEAQEDKDQTCSIGDN